ncbi:MAG: hypothetical protein R2716_13860 [Microthrixaceae bacterium]
MRDDRLSQAALDAMGHPSDIDALFEKTIAAVVSDLLGGVVRPTTEED